MNFFILISFPYDRWPSLAQENILISRFMLISYCLIFLTTKLSCIIYFCFSRATIKWKEAKYFIYMNDVLYFNFRPNAKCSVYPIRVNYSPIF